MTAEAKQKEALALHAAANAALELARTKAGEAERKLVEVGRAIVETEQVKVAALADAQAADQQRAASEVLSQQLSLINRAGNDEALALRIDDASARGVRMDESAMRDDERAAYRAPWSDLARTIARAVASTLARMREALDAARQKADTILGAATARLSVDRARLDAERVNLNEQRGAFESEREYLGHQQDRARQFIETWDAIPSDERTPVIRAALDAARGVFAQAEQLTPAASVTIPHGPRAGDPGQSIKEGGRDNS